MNNKYIISVPDIDVIPNYSELKGRNVIGVILEAGYLFNSIHERQPYFKSVHLDDDVKNISSACLPYGFYFYARGRNSSEIREEVYGLSFVIRKYPPMLGLWLKLDLTSSINKNDSLLDEYYSRLLELGLANQLGLYVTRNELKQITWTKHKVNWWLWICDNFTNDSQLQQDVNYSMFET